MSEQTTTPQEASTPEAEPAAPSLVDTAKPTSLAEGVTQHRNRRDPAADAAKYRHQLRETEAERDRIAQTVETAQNTMYDQAVAAARSNRSWVLTHTGDLSRFTGKNAGDYVHDGVIDNEALQKDIDQLRADRPELFHEINLPIKPDRSQGRGTFSTLTGSRWKDAFRTRK
ncbi:hypothetical protein [Bifidobacterium mongoliense]|uniref:hypothetical protein n=1 Tax=Bifidobacterium mongoliense TaxID=518643 RepID=UPI0030EDEF64